MKTHDHIETIIDSTHLKVQSAGKHNRCKLAFLCLVASSLLLSACVPIVSQPTIDGTMTSSEVIGTPTSTQTESPTYTPTATNTPEPTATPAPLEGRLFFDMNSSGLRDMASFNYVNERLTDERQPLQANLLAAIEAYVAGHPELRDGDLITLEEPGLSGFTVCAGDICTISTSDGSFVLPGAKSTSSLKIIDPNAGTPALEMRYINKWNKAVTVPSYTKDEDANTMAQLEVVPTCEEDAKALVCKLDGDTLQVRDQHLNDTAVLPISKTVQVGKNGEIGLMQGFLTLPFVAEQVEKPFIWNYFDIHNNQIICNTMQQDGVVLNYDGTLKKQGNPFTLISGMTDGHTGLDYVLPIGTVVMNGGLKSTIFYMTDQTSPDPELTIHIIFPDPNSANQYKITYGHFNVQLVSMKQIVYKGQILGLSGDSGKYNLLDNEPVPNLHFGLHQEGPDSNCNTFLDPYRSLIIENISTNFSGSLKSYWSSENNPIFPKLNTGK